MKIRVLICDPIDMKGIDIFKKKGFQVIFEPNISIDKLNSIIQNFDVIIVRSRTKITGNLLKQGSKIKVIGRAGAGLDNIDLKAANKLGIKVFNTPESPSDSVAELTIGLMIVLLRRIITANNSMKEEKWLKKQLKGTLLKGKILGLLGLGNIGLKVAYLAKSFGMQILVYKRNPPNAKLLKEINASYVKFEELLKRSDIISIHIPLNKDTENMVGEKEFSMIKRGAILINTARGGIVNHNALYNNLINGNLAGAAIDVYDVEPPKNFKLIKLNNVVATPHIGSQTIESQNSASVILANKILKYFENTN